MIKKNIFLLSMLIAIIHISIPLYAHINKQKKDIIVRASTIFLGIGKIWLAYYTVYKALNNQFTEERDDISMNMVKCCKTTITKQFMVSISEEEAHPLSQAINHIEHIKNTYRIITYWERSDDLILKPIKPFLLIISTILILSGIHDIYQAVKSNKKAREQVRNVV